jgi:hypothetical protein
VKAHRVVRRRGSHIFFIDIGFTDGGKGVSLTRRPPFTPQEDSWYSIRGWVDPRATVLLEGLGQLKKSTSSELEPATFGLYHSASTNYATACPSKSISVHVKYLPLLSWSSLSGNNIGGGTEYKSRVANTLVPFSWRAGSETGREDRLLWKCSWSSYILQVPKEHLTLRHDSFLPHPQDVEPLLGNDREINDYTTAVTRQQPVNSNRRTVFSVRSVPRCYKQGQLAEQWEHNLYLYLRVVRVQ